MHVKLITKPILAELLANGAKRASGDEADRAPLKLFDPCGRYTFYVFEAERVGDDLQLYGFVVSPLGADCDEWGYSSLNEIAATRNRLRLPMERDRFFDGVTRAEISNGARP